MGTKRYIVLGTVPHLATWEGHIFEDEFSATSVVHDEEGLRVALAAGGDILVPGITIPVDSRITPGVPGTRIRGLGMGNSMIVASSTFTDDRLYQPLAPDITVQDLTLSGGTKRVSVINMDGYSRVADRHTLQRVHLTSCKYGINLSGGPAVSTAEYLEDFQCLQFRITDFDQGGIYMGWEILRPRFQDFYICGKGTDAVTGSLFNGIWIGAGVLDGYILNGVITNVWRHGLEVWYAHQMRDVPGTPPLKPALISTLNPNGSSITIDNLVAHDIGNMGFSLAGCGRSNIGKLTVRNVGSFGVELVDENPGRSDYNVTGPISVTNAAGYAVSIDQIKGGQFSGITIDKVAAIGAIRYGMKLSNCDDVTVRGCTFTDCGHRYVQAQGSTRTNFIRNHFIAKAGENSPGPNGGNFAFYLEGGDCYFHGNVIRGNATNPLRTALNNGTIVTSPTAVPITTNIAWDDGDNYRGYRYVGAMQEEAQDAQPQEAPPDKT